MEEILFELNLLEKSFPFIKFTFVCPRKDIKILVNTIEPAKYRFWYQPSKKNWVIQLHYNTTIFSNYLDNFIEGLILWKFY